ncbi:MAG: hypothetical protein C0593_13950 [Marinilabiliales bacterium]|nr:MAG: hypothetical protein C0593_13950 [Marinilabiliales bacterium]
MRTLILLIFVMLISLSCTRKHNDAPVAEKIQYDVSIKNGNPDIDWWIDNIEGSYRDKLVSMLLTNALNGEIDVYDYFTNNKLTDNELAYIRGRTDTILLQSPDPPYNDTTMIIEQKLEYNDITRVRFLEEWTYDGNDIRTMEKNIIAIAPLLENYDENGNFRGYQPLFWIYTEK